MTHELAPVDLDFLDRAPLRFEYEVELAAPRGPVFDVISSDPGGWSWFPGMEAGGYEGDGTPGVGSRRWVRLTGTTYRETILAWDAPTRWAYRVDESSVPLFEALVEDWVIEPRPGGTSALRWIFAFAPLPDLADTMHDAHELIGRTFYEAMTRLDRHLR
jgi:hypothetical protein